MCVCVCAHGLCRYCFFVCVKTSNIRIHEETRSRPRMQIVCWLPYIIRHTVIRMMQSLPFLLPLLLWIAVKIIWLSAFSHQICCKFVFCSFRLLCVHWSRNETSLDCFPFVLLCASYSLHKCNCQSHNIYIRTLSWNIHTCTCRVALNKLTLINHISISIWWRIWCKNFNIQMDTLEFNCIQ